MAELKRSKLTASLNEASALLPVTAEHLLRDVGSDEAWWLAHDEAGIRGVVSILHSRGKRTAKSWSISPIKLTAKGSSAVTDAEALAGADGYVFVFGSGFLGAKGGLDRRRSFVARFEEDAVDRAKPKRDSLAAPATVIDLGTTLIASVNNATRSQAIDLLESKLVVGRQMKKAAKSDPELDQAMEPLNIEGATFAGDDLVLGLRWPVTASGNPLLAVIGNARSVLTAESPAAEDIASCDISIVAVDAGGKPKRPAGVRALSMTNSDDPRVLDMITGPTERDLAANKAGSAPTVHLRVDLDSAETRVIQTFEGYRKVEGLARKLPAEWIYALDDEEAIVLLTSNQT